MCTCHFTLVTIYNHIVHNSHLLIPCSPSSVHPCIWVSLHDMGKVSPTKTSPENWTEQHSWPQPSSHNHGIHRTRGERPGLNWNKRLESRFGTQESGGCGWLAVFCETDAFWDVFYLATCPRLSQCVYLVVEGGMVVGWCTCTELSPPTPHYYLYTKQSCSVPKGELGTVIPWSIIGI